jgi:hypothetical protein
MPGYPALEPHNTYNVGDYFYSPNRLYFAILQEDGRFVVYRGAGPEDRHDALWATREADKFFRRSHVNIGFIDDAIEGATGATWLAVTQSRADPKARLLIWVTNVFFATDHLKAVMQDDGNFCIFPLEPPDSGAFWATGSVDPLVDYEISNIEYDLPKVKILNAVDFSIYSLTVPNTSRDRQTSTIGSTYTTTTTSGWSDALAIKASIKTTFKAGIPVVGEGGVELLLETQNTYTWNGSDSKARTFSWSAPIAVEPGDVGHVLVTMTTSTIRVPYTTTGAGVFKSGRRASVRINGIYEGQNSHSVKATYTSEKIGPAAPAALLEKSRPQVIPVTVTYTSNQ